KGLALRPTSDYLRETLFNILGPAVDGSRFLDLYAGTGAVGIEAVSRGAIEAVFVENHAAAAKLIREYLASLKITSGVKFIAADGAATLTNPSSLGGHAFDFFFLDPPYASERKYESTMNVLRTSSLLSPNSLVIAEPEKSFAPAESFGDLQKVRTLKQG